MPNENQMVVKLKIAAEKLQSASDALRNIDGVDEVEQVGAEHLRVVYEVNRTGWSALRERLQAVGAYTQGGVLARWRDGWRGYQEQNMRDNLRHKPACCSKPPAGAGRK